MQVEVWQSNEKCMTSECLRKLRKQAGYSRRQLSNLMGWSRYKVKHYEEEVAWFCLHPQEMAKLLQILNVE